jgi:hypothetical protein
MPINAVACGALLLSLALGALVRLCVADQVITMPTAPLSQLANIATDVYGYVLILWLILYLRAPRVPCLAAFGAVWNSIGAALLARYLWQVGEWRSLPLLAFMASLCLFTFLDWRRLVRGSPRTSAW